MDDKDFSKWNSSLRAEIISYLEGQGIDAPSVGEWPAFEIAPKFGIWCIESKKVAGKIGWWAFAGDCPTDYVSEDGQCHPRAALTNLVARWSGCIPHMKAGNQPPNMKFGDGANLRQLAEMLEERVGVLQRWIDDDSLWEDR